MQTGLFALALLTSSALVHGAAYMPIEDDPHTRTWMALPTLTDFWGTNELPEVQRSIMDIANTIALYEPVTVFVSPSDMQRAGLLATQRNVSLYEFQVDDLWMRDTSCVYSYSGCSSHSNCASIHGSDTTQWPLQCVSFNFNGWGGKQAHANDALVAEEVAWRSGVPFVASTLVLEGGGFEVDGAGTAIATESCILNANRNPLGLTKCEVEAELFRTMGIRKVIWTPGIKGRDITDAHIDFYARFVRPGVVIAAQEDDDTIYDYNVTRQAIADLRAATDADGNPLTVHVVHNPTSIRTEWSTNDFAASYINYYVANDVVVAPNFGDTAADAAAQAKLRQLYPTRDVVMMNIDPIAYGGGGIHCATQQQPVGLATLTIPAVTPGPPTPSPSVSPGPPTPSPSVSPGPPTPLLGVSAAQGTRGLPLFLAVVGLALLFGP